MTAAVPHLPANSSVGARGAAGPALLVAWIAGAIYFLARQRTLYGDGSFLLAEIIAGDTYHSHHLAYKPLVAAACRIGAWFGASPYAVAVACSAIGSAIGAGAGYLGLRWLAVSHRAALAATAAACLTPAVVFFASVVEYHGVFFGPAGVAFAASAWLARAPSVARAVLFGACTCGAYLFHATGHLLPATFGAVFVTQRWRTAPEPRGRAVAWLALAVAVHAILAFLVARALERGRPVSAHSLGFLATYIELMTYRPRAFLGTVRGDLLLAFAPLSVLWLVGFWRGAQRTLAAALGLILGGYLTAAFLLTAGIHERGAYLLPVAWPMALLAARGLHPRWLLGSALASAVLAFALVFQHDTPERSRAFARGLLAQVPAKDAVLILSDGLDMHAALIEVHATERVPVRLLATAPASDHDQIVRDLPERLQAVRRRGKRVFLTDEAMALLGNAEYGRLYPAAPRILARLREAFALAPATRDGFFASELVAKDGTGR